MVAVGEEPKARWNFMSDEAYDEWRVLMGLEGQGVFNDCVYLDFR